MCFYKVDDILDNRGLVPKRSRNRHDDVGMVDIWINLQFFFSTQRLDFLSQDFDIDVFGSWEKFLAHAHVDQSPLLARLKAADAAQKDMAAGRKQVEKELIAHSTLSREGELTRGRSQIKELRGADAANPGPKVSPP